MGPQGFWRRLRTRSWADRTLAAEAVAWITLSRIAVLVVPFRHLAPRLGDIPSDPTSHHPSADTEWPERVEWAVAVAAMVTPFATPCLAEAMAGQRMLRRRGITSTIHLGVDKNGEALAAHAWLECGTRTLTGRRMKHHYTEVATFVSRPER